MGTGVSCDNVSLPVKSVEGRRLGVGLVVKIGKGKRSGVIRVKIFLSLERRRRRSEVIKTFPIFIVF